MSAVITFGCLQMPEYTKWDVFLYVPQEASARPKGKRLKHAPIRALSAMLPFENLQIFLWTAAEATRIIYMVSKSGSDVG